MAPVKSDSCCRLHFEKSQIVDVGRFALVGPLHKIVQTLV